MIFLIKMPYDIVDVKRWRIFRSQKLYNLDDLEKLITQLRAIDYSVVESRRTGHECLDAFVKNGVYASRIVSVDKRFPDDDDSIFVSETDVSFSRAISGLSSALSFRVSNLPKDSELASQGSVSSPVGKTSRTDAQFMLSETNTQDNTKRYEELLKTLVKVSLDPNALIVREDFEKTYAKWGEAPAPPRT